MHAPHDIMALANGFSAVTTAQWQALAEKALKGKPFDSLTLRTADGLPIRPLYTSGDRSGAGALPARRPFEQSRPWDIRAAIAHPDPKTANAQVLEALTGGAASVLLRGVTSQADLAAVLDGVYLDMAPAAFDAGLLAPQAADWLAAIWKDKSIVAKDAHAYIHADPIGVLMHDGALPGPLHAHIALTAATGARLIRSWPNLRMFLASGAAVHEAGGTDAQELATVLASAHTYAQALIAAGLDAATALTAIVLEVRLDAQYFLGIAKLRTLRKLWAAFAVGYGVDVPAVIEARSSDRMLTRQDANTNLLRLTAAAFAAGVGGVDACVLAPYTQLLGAPDELARRLTRNTQLVAMEESHLGAVADAAAGSWLIESLTDDLAQAAWDQFQMIEHEGGLQKSLEIGSLQARIQTARESLLAAIADKSQPILGVTVFPPTDPAVPQTAKVSPFKSGPDTRLPGPDAQCAALTPIRLSAQFEAQA